MLQFLNLHLGGKSAVERAILASKAWLQYQSPIKMPCLPSRFHGQSWHAWKGHLSQLL